MILEREWMRQARRRERGVELLTDHVEDEVEPRVPLARTPDADGEAPARPQHAVDLTCSPLGVGYEHQALATENDVVGGIGFLNRFEIERPDADIGEPQLLDACRGEQGHLRRNVGDDNFASRPNQRRRRDSRTGNAAGELQQTLSGLGIAQCEQLSTHLATAALDETAFAPQAGATADHIACSLARISPVGGAVSTAVVLVSVLICCSFHYTA